MSNLEAKTNAMNNANRMLQNEVLSLRTEVAQLKLQLLAHKDCPVTLAMCQPAAPTKSINIVLIFSLSLALIIFFYATLQMIIHPLLPVFLGYPLKMLEFNLNYRHDRSSY